MSSYGVTVPDMYWIEIETEDDQWDILPSYKDGRGEFDTLLGKYPRFTADKSLTMFNLKLLREHRPHNNFRARRGSLILDPSSVQPVTE